MSSADPESSRRCAQCGAILSGQLPQRLCPACMIKRALQPSESEASGDLPPTQTVEAGCPSDSQPVNSGFTHGDDPTLSDGQQFGDYTIVRRLGRGGMGTVYEADHRPTGRRVALKVLSHSLNDPQARARFLREGRLAASINHPNSVYVYGTEQIGDTPTISMELIRGGTLQQLVRARGRLEITDAVDAVLQIIDGLEAADRKGVLHRDVKPANCFVDPDGTIKIGDFGLSISTGPREHQSLANVTQKGTFLGTPAFASPEQLRGEPLDHRSDIYSVGVTLFYLLAGQAPFSGENMVQLLATVLDKQPPSLPSLVHEVPEELDAVVQRCLQKSPGQRFEGYDPLRQALLPWSSMRPQAAPLGSRLIANLLDIVISSCVITSLTLTAQWLAFGRLLLTPQLGADHADFNLLVMLLAIASLFLYYSLSEWRLGKTLGKHLLGLRVVDGAGITSAARTYRNISIKQAAIRAAIFSIVPNLPTVPYNFAAREMTFEMLQQGPMRWVGMVVGFMFYALKAALFVTARRRNGFAAVHDLASGTRVVCQPRLPVRPAKPTPVETFDAADEDDRIGPYHVLRVLWESETDRLILGYDATLLRRVWLHVRPVGTRQVDQNTRNLARVTRLRWLGAKRTASEAWDCYESPTGRPFAVAVDDGLGWEAALAALRDLANELQTACRESSLPERVSLAQLWITDEETIKLLPFPIPAQYTEQDATLPSDEQTAVRLFAEAAGYVHQAVDLTRGSRGTPLTAYQTIGRLREVDTLDEATRQLEGLAAQPTVNVPQRAVAMLVVSLALPCFMFVANFIASIAMEQQKSRMPKITELSKITILLDIEQQTARGDQTERVAAVETLISANYGDVIQDRQQMNSFYGMVSIPPAKRQRLRQLAQLPPPPADAVVAAKARYDEMMAERRFKTPAEMGFFSTTGVMFIAVVIWMELIWLPSLVTAIACRGGALLWIFGLTYVNQHGEPASRLRVLTRMLLGGTGAVAIAAVFLGSQGIGGPFSAGVQYAVMGVVILLVALSFFMGGRQIQDRLAGTYLVGR